ncbi:inhibitor of nuclear factor kappa-B kinase subunit epsilon-like [Euwallacea fornicatus]|uniref:inhibitor of nuclear factor kappa-B kinase subunit epsilon-like n=1 Tax=Euwallacea fornicatus TaxID=995702 RepID=UPI00338FC1F3
MVPAFRHSKNYYWSTDDILGRGATSTVYHGVNWSTGENVAVKVVTNLVSVREFEVLKKINHENIVKLIAIEQEETCRVERNGLKRHIIVTELCTGGCLDSIIQQPQNIHGLTDSEFLTVLKHLYQGIRYLRENNLVHRDLKPGNIMKSIKDDGSVVYKLIDFGAARELSDEAEFKSFYGTEEYLAPDMYRKAFLNNHGNLENMTFQATVDLWSIGATLYHIATGRLPFVPFGGRQNMDKRVMHYITTNKGSGVISGIQKDYNGLDIDWSRELPEDCLLSTGLKKIITPLLAGLLESDNNKIWSFEKFFHQVEAVLSRKVVHVFYINSPSLLQIYLDGKSTIQQLQHEVSSQIHIYESAMYFIHKSSVLSKQEKIPGTTQYSPVFLIYYRNPIINISPLTTLSKEINFTVNDVKEDYSQAKKACATGFAIHRDIEKYSLYSKLICDIVASLTHYTKREFCQLEKQNLHLLKTMNNLKRTAEIFEFSKKVSNFGYLSTQTSEDLKKISDEFHSISQTISALNKKYSDLEFAKSQWRELTKGLEVSRERRHTIKSRMLVDQLEKARQNLKLNSRKPQSNDYLIEKKRCRQGLSRLSDLLKDEVYSHYRILLRQFGDWYKIVQVDLLKIDILTSMTKNVEVNTEEFEEKLDIDLKNYREQVSATSAKKSSSSTSSKRDSGDFTNFLNNNRSKCKDILKENMTISAVWNDFLIANESFLLEKTEALERLSFTED